MYVAVYSQLINVKPSLKWSICKNDVVLARGKLDLEHLQMCVELHEGQGNAQLLSSLMSSIRNANTENRDKSLVAINVTVCTLSSEKWGRVPRGM